MNQHQERQTEKFVFEISWETCNPVGSIYKVLATKAPKMREYLGENYILIGPSVWKHEPLSQFFQPEPLFPELMSELEAAGFSVHTGRWLVDGKPKCILIDFTKQYNLKDQILGNLWDWNQVDSITGDWNYVDPVLFGYAAGLLVERILADGVVPESSKVICHWHEWKSGAGLLYLKRKMPQVSSVFTAHKTVLGNAISEKGQDLNEVLHEVDAADQARSLGLTAAFSLESVLVEACDCFTTSSNLVASESELFFGRGPDLILPNGLDNSYPDPDKLRPEAVQAARNVLFDLASLVTGHDFNREKTLLLLACGRHEFVNKGVDLTLSALEDIKPALEASGKTVLCFFAFPTAVSGPRACLLARSEGKADENGPLLTTHDINLSENDPVLKGMVELGIQNRPGDALQAIYVPTWISAEDPLFRHSYNDLLPAFDLCLVPSFYEPWGYSGLESLACGVPTVTSDLAGVGQWIQSVKPGSSFVGGAVLHRRGRSFAEASQNLVKYLTQFVNQPKEKRAEIRLDARRTGDLARWEFFGKNYLNAYELAVNAKQRQLFVTGERFAERQAHSAAPLEIMGFSGLDLATPRMRPFTVNNRMPEGLSRLRDLAYNLWWSWTPAAEKLFVDLAPDVWVESEQNPVVLLNEVSQQRLNEMAQDESFLVRIQQVYEQFLAYLEQRKEAHDHPKIAYFCMEYGMAQCLPLYSGGLGVLAGDHLKSASDQGIPLVAIGLAYRRGYFVQRYDRDGNQQAEPVKFDFASLPMRLLRTRDGEEYNIRLPFGGHFLNLRIWLVEVGSVSLYLLDSDHPDNAEEDREITSSLYGGDNETRLRQEIILGVGGRQLIYYMGLKPKVYHMNEGHASFLILSRMSKFVRYQGLDMPAALAYCRATSVFTTHTPVPAGHDSFTEDLMRPYFSMYQDLLGCSWSEIMSLGRYDARNKGERFSMTLLGLRGAASVNGVSEIHGGVSRKNLHAVVPGFHEAEVPIGHITNGVHARTWLAGSFQSMLARALGPDWAERSDTPWARIREIPNSTYLRAKQELKKLLLAEVRGNLEASWFRRSDSPALLAKIQANIREDALVVGFARRFAPYKRAKLLFRDRETLARILNKENRPVLFLFAGKAHPADELGKSLIKDIFQLSRQPEFAGKVILLENYNIALAKLLVQGCDVWLNNPTRPLEASGTSGMKAAINGGLNLSVADGWWAEGYNGKNGWTIGEERVYEEQDLQDELDSQHLYTLLEEEVIPLYFHEEDAKLSMDWIEMAKEAMISCLPQFSGARMLRDYDNLYYKPGIERALTMSANGFAQATAVGNFKKRMREHWKKVRIEEVQLSNMAGEMVFTGEDVVVHVNLSHGELRVDELQVQFVTGDRNRLGDIVNVKYLELTSAPLSSGHSVWTGTYQPQKSGTKAYGVRVVPHFPGEKPKVEMDFGLVKWA